MEKVHEKEGDNIEEKSDKIHKIEAAIDDSEPIKILRSCEAVLPVKKSIHKEPEKEIKEDSRI